MKPKDAAHEVGMYTISETARKIGRHSFTIKDWIYKKFFAPKTLTLPGGQKIYVFDDDDVRTLKEIRDVLQRGRRSPDQHDEMVEFFKAHNGGAEPVFGRRGDPAKNRENARQARLKAKEKQSKG